MTGLLKSTVGIVGKAKMILERISVGLENVVLGIDSGFFAEVAVIGIYGNQKFGAQKWPVLKALRTATGHISVGVAGSGDKSEPFVRTGVP